MFETETAPLPCPANNSVFVMLVDEFPCIGCFLDCLCTGLIKISTNIEVLTAMNRTKEQRDRHKLKIKTRNVRVTRKCRSELSFNLLTNYYFYHPITSRSHSCI